MKKFLCVFALVFCVVLGGSSVQAQNTQNFEIDSFEADYYLSKDAEGVSRLKVREEITAVFPDYNQNHGIERAIPSTYKSNNLNLQVESVKKVDGMLWNYTTYDQNNNLIVRIGDADKYVLGEQTYIIEYSLRDVITFYDDHEEWFWDVNGDQWQQPFGSVVARIHLTPELAKAQSKISECFAGLYGASTGNCSVNSGTAEEGAVIAVASTEYFHGGENLSFVLGFEEGTFTKYQPNPFLVALALFSVFTAVFILPIVTFIVMYKKWKKIGNDPKGKGIIVAQYFPQAGMNPLLANVILTEKLETKAVSATILDLCVRGYVKLYEVKNKKQPRYELEFTKEAGALSLEEQSVVNMMFNGTGKANIGEKIDLTAKKNKLHSAFMKLKKLVYDQVVSGSYYAKNPEKARTSYGGWAMLLIIAGLACFFLFSPWLIPLAIGLLASGLITLIFSHYMPAKTVKGVEAKEYLEGLKIYMNLAEKDRIKFLQGPDTAEKINVGDSKQMVKLYERLLPYAMLFGIEKEWAKQFAGLYGEGESPNWYVGRGAFNAAVFSSAIAGFNSVSAGSFTAPSSSGSSGFSGGGFSGGGGGGGGGGGW
jgi:uncharacterized membrane protein